MPSLISPLYVKQHDLQPYYYVQVKDGSGTNIDVTGATIYCTMKRARAGTRKIDRQTAGITINSGTLGCFYYAWQGSDTADAGKYYIEFEINPTAGGKFTVPADPNERAEVVIMESLDAS